MRLLSPWMAQFAASARPPAELLAHRWRILAVAFAFVALAVPMAAFAWAQNYVLNTYFNPGGIALSGANASLNWNESQFQTDFGGDRMQLTLCDTSYNCYPYTYDSDGFVSDDRTISYGRAKCNAYQFNAGQIFVHWCYTRNS
jgi:hypothetical protein